MANIKPSAETAYAIKAEKQKTKNSVLKYELDDLNDEIHVLKVTKNWLIASTVVLLIVIGVFAGLKIWGNIPWL